MRKEIGKYKVVRRLGAGGFGEVYLVEHPTLRQMLAIKVFEIKDLNLARLVTSASSDAGIVLRDRFVAEAQILQELSNHRNIADIKDLDYLDEDTPYYVMPYLPKSLTDIIGKDIKTPKEIEDLPPNLHPKKIRLSDALNILQQLLEALAAVHARDIIHRDIKPANILFDGNDTLKLCDFGIAKVPESGHTTQTGIAMGSWAYMSPEQCVNAKYVDKRSDVYSVGVLAYRIITGDLPAINGANIVDMVPEVGQPLSDLIKSTLDRNPDKRPKDGGEFLVRLKLCVQLNGDRQKGITMTTQVGEPGVAAVNERLEPMVELVRESLLNSVELTDDQSEKLEETARIRGVSVEELRNLVNQAEKALEPELRLRKNFLQEVKQQVEKSGGVLSNQQRQSLIESGKLAGLEEGVSSQLLAANLIQKKKPLNYFNSVLVVFLFTVVVFGLYTTLPEIGAEAAYPVHISVYPESASEVAKISIYKKSGELVEFRGGNPYLKNGVYEVVVESKGYREQARWITLNSDPVIEEFQMILSENPCSSIPSDIFGNRLNYVIDVCTEEAKKGVVTAQLALGEYYFSGTRALAPDYDRAREWLHLASQSNSEKAQKLLARMYDDGLGAIIDRKKSFQLYLQAAESGDAEAQFSVGLKYVRGIGVEVNHQKAAHWFSGAAEKGYELASSVHCETNPIFETQEFEKPVTKTRFVSRDKRKGYTLRAGDDIGAASGVGYSRKKGCKSILEGLKREYECDDIEIKRSSECSCINPSDDDLRLCFVQYIAFSCISSVKEEETYKAFEIVEQQVQVGEKTLCNIDSLPK